MRALHCSQKAVFVHFTCRARRSVPASVQCDCRRRVVRTRYGVCGRPHNALSRSTFSQAVAYVHVSLYVIYCK